MRRDYCVCLPQPRYEESMGRKKVLEDELTDLEGKLQRAEKLVTGMPGCADLMLVVHRAFQHPSDSVDTTQDAYSIG